MNYSASTAPVYIITVVVNYYSILVAPGVMKSGFLHGTDNVNSIIYIRNDFYLFMFTCAYLKVFKIFYKNLKGF